MRSPLSGDQRRTRPRGGLVRSGGQKSPLPCRPRPVGAHRALETGETDTGAFREAAAAAAADVMPRQHYLQPYLGKTRQNRLRHWLEHGVREPTLRSHLFHFEFFTLMSMESIGAQSLIWSACRHDKNAIIFVRRFPSSFKNVGFDELSIESALRETNGWGSNGKSLLPS